MLKKTKSHRDQGVPDGQQASKFRKIERQGWWRWSSAIVVSLLLTVGLSSFIMPQFWNPDDNFMRFTLPQAVRGLLRLILIFDVYTVFQQLQTHRIRRQLMEREVLFRLIGESAADLIAVVDMDGRRIYNSMAYQKVLGYPPEELRGSSALGQIHPKGRARVQEAAAEARRTGIGTNLEYRIRHKDGT